MDTFTCGGNGGQNVNRNRTGVRFTHLQTGLAAECREFKSQAQNKKAAFHKLGALILNWHRALEFKAQVRTIETIRTYHEVENRVKDHLSGQMTTWDEATDDLSEMIDARRQAMRENLDDDKRSD